jgi:hypothetical protein
MRDVAVRVLLVHDGEEHQALSVAARHAAAATAKTTIATATLSRLHGRCIITNTVTNTTTAVVAATGTGVAITETLRSTRRTTPRHGRRVETKVARLALGRRHACVHDHEVDREQACGTVASPTHRHAHVHITRTVTPPTSSIPDVPGYPR